MRHQGIIVARLIPACAGKTRRLWAWRPPSPAHPRACGENVLAASSASSTPGSSPRVRGKPPRERAGPPVRGLIPACAGKTRLCSTTCPEPRAHPRACGENARILSRTQWTRGSSPRVRGKHPLTRCHFSSRGLIPARAGKTRSTWRTPSPRQAHPRACGENNGMGEGVVGCFGSSPRVRGKPIEQQFLRARVGLIPARAGKTPSTTSPKKARPAHPRACGENIKTTAPPAIEAGSSPRVRGKRGVSGMGARPRRLIPARAGKTYLRFLRTLMNSAHPRACGENASRAAQSSAATGSSPRVRGKRPRGDHEDSRPVAHPRACGENAHLQPATIGEPGSSPRVRGKPGDPVQDEGQRRLIPARAGKTPRQRR